MSKRVLVIDDQRQISEIIKTVLEEKGAKVEIDFNPSDIKNQIIKSKPDLLFIDYNIPGLDVEKLINDFKKNTRIILITGTDNIKKLGKKLGVKTLAKPFDIDTLTQLLRS